MARDDEPAPHRIAFVEVPSTGGRIGITPCPGTPIFPSAREEWLPNLVADLDAVRAWGALAVVTLIRAGEPTAPHLADLQQEVEARGIEWHHAPIDDGDIPDAEFEALWRHVGPRLRALLRQGRSVLVHCLGGRGRSGTVCARLLVELGEDPSAAIARVRRVRRGAIATTQQRLYVQACRQLAD